ncbi:hypothetical protein Goari_018185 [Gossypium aridum]|uniref:Uncharacterized protein n=1 Tax=Gossypium aridum TaxID=34290 RepID=A0A7J8WNT5_GOSAI|nr:hypothetical protein [Gossypium aridum]
MKLWRLPRQFLKLPTSLGPSWNVATNVTPSTMILVKIMTLSSSKRIRNPKI